MVNWLKNRLRNMNEIELYDLYTEILNSKQTGLFVESVKFKSLAKEYSNVVSHTGFNECWKLIENEILLEIAHRYFSGGTYAEDKEIQ